jgi:hypothetical protein
MEPLIALQVFTTTALQVEASPKGTLAGTIPHATTIKLSKVCVQVESHTCEEFGDENKHGLECRVHGNLQSFPAVGGLHNGYPKRDQSPCTTH